MATAIDRFNDFKERLDEMGILEVVDIQRIGDETPEQIHCRIEIKDHKLLNHHILHHAVMGLIAHFKNRKWISGWGYTYIMKSLHSITFSNESD